MGPSQEAVSSALGSQRALFLLLLAVVPKCSNNSMSWGSCGQRWGLPWLIPAVLPSVCWALFLTVHTHRFINTLSYQTDRHAHYLSHIKVTPLVGVRAKNPALPVLAPHHAMSHR